MVIVFQYLVYRKVLRWLPKDPISWALFSSLFLILRVICFRYKKPYAVRAMKRKKPIRDNNRPLPLVMGKIKQHETIGKARII